MPGPFSKSCRNSNSTYVICIQETHLTPKYHPVFQNYTILRQNRPPFRGKGGGLLICIKTSLEFSEVNLSGPSTCMEVFGVTVGGYAIFTVYNPPSHHRQTENFVFLSRFNKVVLCGNFNAHHGMWGSLSANHNSRVLLSVLETHDFVVLNTSVPTHYSLSGRYKWIVLDLSIVSADVASRYNATVHNEFIGSDHSIVQIAIRGSDTPTKTHIPRWRQRFSDLCDLSLPSISIYIHGVATVVSIMWNKHSTSSHGIHTPNKMFGKIICSVVECGVWSGYKD